MLRPRHASTGAAGGGAELGHGQGGHVPAGPPPPGRQARAIRFSKIFSDFSSQGLHHLILYLKWPKRTFSSKN